MRASRPKTERDIAAGSFAPKGTSKSAELTFVGTVYYGGGRRKKVYLRCTQSRYSHLDSPNIPTGRGSWQLLRRRRRRQRPLLPKTYETSTILRKDKRNFRNSSVGRQFAGERAAAGIVSIVGESAEFVGRLEKIASRGSAVATCLGARS